MESREALAYIPTLQCRITYLWCAMQATEYGTWICEVLIFLPIDRDNLMARASDLNYQAMGNFVGLETGMKRNKL
jgi:hypothetical protein